MELGLADVPSLVYAATVWALAAALLGLGSGKRANRVFALFLAFVGLAEVLGLLRSTGVVSREFWLRVEPYAVFPWFWILLYFAAVYPRPRRWLPPGLAGAAPFLAGALLVCGLYLADHGLLYDRRTATGLGNVGFGGGPLFYYRDLTTNLGPALVAAVFARDYVRDPHGPGRSGPLIVSLGLMVPGMFFHTLALTYQVRIGFADDLGDTLSPILAMLGLGLVAAYVAAHAARARDPAVRRNLAWYTGACGLLVAWGSLLQAIAVLGPTWTLAAGTWTLFATKMVLPLLLAYAVARHQVFGLDLRVKWTLQQSTVVSAFVVAYFAVSQAAGLVLAGSLGDLAGIGAVGALVVGLGPLRRLAEGVAGAILPGVAATPAYFEERKLEVYRVALEEAGARAGTDPGTARRLARLRQELGITDRDHAVLAYAVRTGRGPPPDAEVPAGAVLLGRYRVERALGQGAYGRAYLATATGDPRPAVVKVLRAPRGARASPAREARAIAAVRHPKVVELREVAEVEGRVLLVMEYLEGGSLADRLQRGPLDPGAFRRLARDLLEALGAVHAAGIVHRDVKPSNILLAADGTAKLADFGIAQVPGSESTMGTQRDLGSAIGTVRYMSPEQARGRKASPQSDLFSAGATLYEAWTGQPYLAPRRDESAVELQLRAAGAGPFRGRVRGPVALRAWFARALHPDPGRRFGTAAEMLGALERALPPPPAR